MKHNAFHSLFRSAWMVVFALLSTMIWAQTTVKGVVEDATGEPVIGASVLVQGTTIGTITDFDGVFVVSCDADATLMVSYMGYKSQEVPVNGQSVIKVVLHEDNELLDEVVVVGYGVVKKNDATGSVTAIKPDAMNKALTTTATDMLSGKIAGVNVTTGDGTPGGGATIRVRGGSSLNASNDPLIVIDGLAMDNEGIKGVSNPLSLVNPSDIETFTVLKDASATAIYGSRASNGVIIITTKKGAANQKLKVNYSGNVSASNLNNTYDVLTGDGVRAYADWLYGGTKAWESNMSYLGDANTDWQSQIYRVAISTDHNISITGGTKNMPYRFSIGYTDQNGIIKTSNMQRVTASLNLNPTFFDKHLTINFNAKGMYIFNRYADGVSGAATAMDPTRPVYDESLKQFGGYFQFTQSGSSLNDTDPMWDRMQNAYVAQNPLAALEQKTNKANSGSFVGNIEADYKIHGFEDMHLHANFGADYSYGKQKTVISPYSGSNNYFGWDGWEDKSKYNLSFNAYAQYYKDFTETQHFDVMAGYEWQHFYNKSHSEGHGMYPTTNVNPDNAGKPYNPTSYNSATESYLVSFFGRANWSGWNQVMLTATVRADGSSRFAPSHRWGIFPSVALGWKIKETFLQDVNAINDLKLRLGWGITGQQNINNGDYPYMPVYVQNQEGAFSSTGVTYQAALDAGLLNGLEQGVDYVVGANDGYVYYQTYRPKEYNPALTWEKTTTYNAGLDFAFLNNRVSGSLDYYYRLTNDLISYVDFPAGVNFKTRVISNIGSLYNQGVEFAINGVILDRKNFKWEMGYNVAWNHNEITKLTSDATNAAELEASGIPYMVRTGGIGNDQYVQAHAVGHPASAFYVFETAKDEETGMLYLVDRNEDGVIDVKDKYFYHSPNADVTMGFNSKWQFYGFDLGITFRASLGNYVYNKVLSDNAQYITTLYDSKFNGYHNLLMQSLVAYYVDGYGLRNVENGIMADYLVQKASFLRCDNITLGYSFNSKSNKFQGRVYATVSNPFVISPYKGLDPEIYGGIDNNMYPRCMSTTLGVNFTF
ncbi:MAG: SusC/RagA family TonB-linked outer membrane protein [Paludibacteraceae bacterium]|nr:SusC/RagA family TonB-linked outer membrane protein [Paludibacteraceae bacterium]